MLDKKPKVKTLDSPLAIRPIKFTERPGADPFNASEVVCILDSRFLFCDNNISKSLFEFHFNPDGELAGPLVHHEIRGVRPEAIDDLECMTMAEVDGVPMLFVSSSFCLKKRKGAIGAKKNRAGKLSSARESLIRMKISDGNPEAEIIPCFRSWLVEKSAILGDAAKRVPDDYGLNIEGLAWDPRESSLLFGLRTPVVDGRPLILRARVKQPNGIWNLSNFEMLPPITLAVDGANGSQGIRSIKYDPSRNVFLIVIGNAISGTKTPFQLYAWDGNPQGTVSRFKHLSFHEKMKPEGVTHGTIGGRGVVMFVDDAGGYQYLWDDDPRLQLD
jgi:hypothetical protein